MKEYLLNESLTRGKLNNDKYSLCGFSWFFKTANGRKITFQTGTWVGFNNIILTDYNSQTTVIMLSNTTEFPTKKEKMRAARKILRYAMI